MARPAKPKATTEPQTAQRPLPSFTDILDGIYAAPRIRATLEAVGTGNAHLRDVGERVRNLLPVLNQAYQDDAAEPVPEGAYQYDPLSPLMRTNPHHAIQRITAAARKAKDEERFK